MLSTLTKRVIVIMQRLRVFSVLDILKHMDQKTPLRRIYDVVAILMGCGFVCKDPCRKKSYFYRGMHGVQSGKVSATRLLQCLSHRFFLHICNGKWHNKQRLSKVIGLRRYYDVLNVMEAAGIVVTNWKGQVRMVKEGLQPKEEGDERKVLTVSDDDATNMVFL